LRDPDPLCLYVSIAHRYIWNNKEGGVKKMDDLEFLKNALKRVDEATGSILYAGDSLYLSYLDVLDLSSIKKIGKGLLSDIEEEARELHIDISGLLDDSLVSRLEAHKEKIEKAILRLEL
jgi:hypothetical protein